MNKKKEDPGSYEPVVRNVEPSQWRLRKGHVFVHCYGTCDIWDRRKAKAFYKEAMLSCEGPERERYMRVWAALDEFPMMNSVNDGGEAWNA